MEPPEFVDVAGTGELQDGEMIAVDVCGKRVLLARVAQSYFAIGAICTHERANLDEGSLLGHVVYCPLHYSAFDVRSGQVMGPPADRPTSSYRVKIEDGRVLVSTQPAQAHPEEAAALRPLTGTASTHTDRLQTAGSRQALLFEAIADFGWLNVLSDRLTSVVTPLRLRLQPTGIMDLLHGTRLLGHAVHPALSDLPIGLWTGSLLLYVLGSNYAAAVLSLVGLLAAAATLATGFADWSVSDGHDRRIGLFHGLINIGAVLIQLASYLAYVERLRLLAVAFSAVSLVTTLSAAYLGGHLVLGRAVMVNRNAWTRGPMDWVRMVKDVELLEGRAMPADVEGRKVLIYRGEGHISAIEAACGHAGGPLSMGTVRDGVVTCPWHSSRFRLRDGAVLRGPASQPQPVLEVRVRDGWVEVRGRR